MHKAVDWVLFRDSSRGQVTNTGIVVVFLMDRGERKDLKFIVFKLIEIGKHSGKVWVLKSAVGVAYL